MSRGPAIRQERPVQTFARLHLVRSSMALIGTQAATAVLGYGYWLLVAHRWPAVDVGIANSVMAAGLLCALIAGQGLVPAVLLALPRADGRYRVALGAVAVAGAGVLSLVVGAAALAVIPRLLPSLHMLWSPVTASWFLLAVAAQAAGTVVDAVAIALRARSVVLMRNIAVSVAKISLLVASAALHLPAVIAVLASVALPGCVSVLGGLFAATRHCRTGREWSLVVAFRALVAGVTWHYVSSLSAACPQYLLALVVTARLGSAQNAYFSMAWLLSTAVFMVSPAVSQALLTEGSRTDGAGVRQVRHAARLTALALPLPMVTLIAGGGLLLAVFGANYTAAWPTLIILVVGSLPDSTTNVLCALLRIRGRLRASALVNIVIAAVAVVGAWLVAPIGGIASVAAVWAAAQVVGSATALPAVGRSTSNGHNHVKEPVSL